MIVRHRQKSLQHAALFCLWRRAVVVVHRRGMTTHDRGTAQHDASRTGSDRIAYSVDEAAVRAGIGRDAVYDAIREKRLVARKWGRRTIITDAALRAFLESLPIAHPGSAARARDSVRPHQLPAGEASLQFALSAPAKSRASVQIDHMQPAPIRATGPSDPSRPTEAQ